MSGINLTGTVTVQRSTSGTENVVTAVDNTDGVIIEYWSITAPDTAQCNIVIDGDVFIGVAGGGADVINNVQSEQQIKVDAGKAIDLVLSGATVGRINMICKVL